jgi:hypothetical protein
MDSAWRDLYALTIVSGEEVHEHVVSRHQIDQLGRLRLIKFASLYFASLTRPAIAQLREFGEELTIHAGRNYQCQHERKEGLCGRWDNEGASLINEDSHLRSVLMPGST